MMKTYSILLDDLDLALLPVPSLSYNHMLKKEHFEVQLLAKEEAKDQSVNIHPCHICAIDVPAAFWNSHCASAKHRANARIATAAAQRMSALITATTPPHTPLTSEQFCDSCTCIAGKDHEKTKAHRLSVTQDRMLCNLVMIYTGEDVNDDRRVNVKEKDSKDPMEQKPFKKYKDIEVDLSVVKRDVNHFLTIENDEEPTTKTPNDKNIAEIDLNVFKEKKILTDNENEKGTETPNENIPQNTDEKTLEGKIETIPIKYTQSSTLKDEKNNAMHLPDQSETQKTASIIPENKNTEVNAKKSRTRKRKNKNQLGSETNITTEDQNVNQNEELSVPDPNNKGLDVKDAFVSYYPLVDESAVHYPYIKEMLQLRCLICDCVVPRSVYNRITHLKGRPHVANAKKQLHIVKKQLNDIQ